MKKKVADKNPRDNSILNLCFEEGLEKLELVVKELERGDLPLEDALEKFSVGVMLSKICLTKLNAADRQIDKILREEKGQIVEYPLDLEEDD